MKTLLLLLLLAQFAFGQVSSVSPSSNALNVSSNTNIEIQFSNAMNTSSFNDTSSFIVSGNVSGRHRGVFSFSGENAIATFTPTTAFAGGEIVTINATGNLKDNSNANIQPFTSQFTVVTNISSAVFTSTVIQQSAAAIYAVSIGDLDDDGDGDMAVPNYYANTVSVSLNNGDGMFAATVDYPTGSYPVSVSIGDVDGDGDADLLVSNANGNTNTVSILKNNGDGTFTYSADYFTGNFYPRSGILGDMDGDGDADVVVANWGSLNVAILNNNGDGTFTAPTLVESGTNPWSIVIGDVDNDGDGDLVVANYGDTSVSVLKSNGDGTFAATVKYYVGENPYSVSFGDIDGDGDGDIAAANLTSNTVSVLKNNGDGTYAAKTDYATGDSPQSVSISDIDGDGDGDLVVANNVSNTVSIYKNNGNGTFAPKVDTETDAGPSTLYVADLNGNGNIDIVVANPGSNSIQKLMNNGQSISEDFAGYLTGVSNSAVDWGDYDNDGDLDILLTGDSGGGVGVSKIYQNTGSGFAEVYSGTLTGVLQGSADWGDYDSDGDLDILITGYQLNGVAVSKIYENTGSGFSEVFVESITGVAGSSADWGDFDNDGDLDILLMGYSATAGYISKIYQNTGNGFTEVYAGNLTRTATGSASWGDFDNDGDLDVLLTGYSGDIGFNSQVYENTGDGFVLFHSFTGLAYSSSAWGDYDEDGDLDIVMTGNTTILYLVQVYENTGNDFSEVFVNQMNGLNYSSVAWGDYDNDGDLDILLNGYNSLVPKSVIYQNTGSGFTKVYVGKFTDAHSGSVAWGDYDNDNDLDILITGITNAGPISEIYNNSGTTFNTVPTPPTGLSSSSSGVEVTLRWDRATDAQTSQKGLTYNLRIGTTPNGINTQPPMTNINNGYRRVVQIGSVNHDTAWTMKNLASGTYYWSVQAIDNHFSGSLFGQEGTFTYVTSSVFAITPSQNALNVSPSATIEVTFTVAMNTSSFNDTSSFIISGSLSGRHSGTFLFSGGNTIVTFDPTTDFIYGEVVTIIISNNLKDYTDTNIQPFVAQFTVETYSSTAIFTESTGYPTGSVPEIIFVADIDGDGDGDLAVPNALSNSVSIYMNTGDGTFASSVDYPTAGEPGSVNISDIDGDGDGDLIVATTTATVSVLRNNGDGTFAPKEDYPSGDAYTVVVSDVNGDGNSDIVVPNFWGGAVSVLMNNGDGTFASAVDYATGSYALSVFVSDVDIDGDGDITMTNFNSNTISVLMNNGDGTFAASVNYTSGVNPYFCYVSDLDGDGDGDIAVTNYGANTVSIFINDGNGIFASKVDYPTGNVPSGIFISDVDGDGDGDIAVTNFNDASVSILRNNGDGTFAARDDYPTENGPYGIYVSDLNGNGEMDIVVSNYSSNSISVILNGSCGSMLPDTLRSAGLLNYYNEILTIQYGSSPYNYAVTSGALPNGISLSSDGYFSGAPTSFGAYAFSVTAMNGSGCSVQKDYTMQIDYTSGSGLALDGTNDYVEIEDADEFTDSSITVEAWIYPYFIDGAHSIVSKYNSNANDVSWTLQMIDGRLNFIVYEQTLMYLSVITSTPVITTSNWQHVCGTYNRSTQTISLFVNGILQTSVELDGSGISSIYNGNTPVYIGTATNIDGNLSQFFYGQIDEVRIWNTERTPSEIYASMYSSLAGNDPMLVAYYRFDERFGNSSYDASGNGRYAFLQNGAGWTNSSAPVGAFTIAVSSNANGTVSPSGNVAVVPGTNKSFSIAANVGYHIDSVLADNVYLGAIASKTFTNVTSNHTLRVVFTMNDTTRYRTFSAGTDLSLKANKLNKRGKPATAPNSANWRDTVIARNGKSGLALGILQTDKTLAKNFGWIRYKKGADFAKFYTAIDTANAFNAPFDSIRKEGSIKRKRLVKEFAPNNKIYTNPLAQSFGVFKLNLLSSQKGITPKGFDSLVYLSDGSMWGNMPLTRIANTVDSVLTYYKTKKFPNGDSAIVGANILKNLRTMLNDINGAFDTSISLAGGDSISSSGLQFKGKIKVGDVSFLKRVPGIKFAPMLSLNINEVPLAYSLEQNYPNPFNPTTAIGFSLLAVGNVTLKIYDILGREV
ncbi:MAG: FG-GAP-like repeat-containing protein, partial [Bacteroidota bacterium]